MKWNNVIYIIWIMMTQSQKNKYTKIFFTLISFLLHFNLWSLTQEVLWYKHNKTQKSTEFYRFCTKNTLRTLVDFSHFDLHLLWIIAQSGEIKAIKSWLESRGKIFFSFFSIVLFIFIYFFCNEKRVNNAF